MYTNRLFDRILRVFWNIGSDKSSKRVRKLCTSKQDVRVRSVLNEYISGLKLTNRAYRRWRFSKIRHWEHCVCTPRDLYNYSDFHYTPALHIIIHNIKTLTVCAAMPLKRYVVYIDPVRDPFKHFTTPSHSPRTTRPCVVVAAYLNLGRAYTSLKTKNKTIKTHTPFVHSCGTPTSPCPGTVRFVFAACRAAGIKHNNEPSSSSL